MLDQGAGEQGTDDSFDRIAVDLRRLRLDAGEVSYAEIVRRIARRREADGVPLAASRPARTTVYDAFRTGRSRINPQLVGEIARALGGDDTEVARWQQRCHRARRRNEHPGTAGSHLLDRDEPSSPDSVRGVDESASEPSVTEEAGPNPGWWGRHPRTARALLAVVCLGINFTGYAAVEFFSLPLFLDAIGTGVAALVLGPWRGALIGAATNVLGYTIHGSMALPFGLQSVALALVWGYGAYAHSMTRTLRRYFTLNVAAGLSHLLVTVPLLLLVFDGGTGHAGDVVTHKITAMAVPQSLAVLFGHTMIAVSDALVAGFVILVIMGFVKTMPPFRERCSGLLPFADAPADSSVTARMATTLRSRVRVHLPMALVSFQRSSEA